MFAPAPPFEPIGIAAVAFFVLGLVSTFAGLCLVLVELGVSLDAIKFEHQHLNALGRGEGLMPHEFPGAASHIDREGEG